MKKHGNSKYRPKYAKDLRNGMRKDGKSIAEVCNIWGVTKIAYDGWRKTFPTFEHAHQIGEQDKQAWWFQIQRKVASGEQAGNASIINFALKNENDYVDKSEVHNTHEEQITTLRIEVHKPMANIGNIIEHGTSDMLDTESARLLQPAEQSRD